MRPWWLTILVVLGAAILLQAVSVADDRVPFSRFREMAEQGELTELEIRGDVYVGRAHPDPATRVPRTFRTGRIEAHEKELLAVLDEQGVPYTSMATGRVPSAVWWLLPLGAVVGFALLAARKAPASTPTNPMAHFGKNKARLYVETGPPVTFREVAGCAEAKAELAEVVDFLRAPERYRRLGGRMPRGVLLIGPPGTGKTLLARAVAGEASVPFFSACGSEFVEMFVGVGAARVRDLFSQAREKGSCIVFIDEIDAVGRHRGAGMGGGNDEREQTLNQLLTEMDGFDVHSGMIVIAATNRPEVLDSALLRAGRFDRRVHVDRPDLEERRDILAVHARKIVLAPDANLLSIAAQTAGLCGADLANVINESALLAARRRAAAVGQVDLDEAIERVLAGLERRTRRLGPREKLVIAYHEVGHALMAELLPSQDKVRKVSIVPRGSGALGYTIQQPEEERFLWSRQEILDKLVVLLGGRVAEEEVVGDISTGAQDDLANATDLARRMVRELGMGRTVGLSALEPRKTMSFLGNDRGGAGGSRECSDITAREVDAEVAGILGDAESRARALLRDNREMLDRIARKLYETETMSGEELRALMASG